MSLNFQINADNEALQWWNYDLNHEDILHDAENIKELRKNQLFNQCLNEILVTNFQNLHSQLIKFLAK